MGKVYNLYRVKTNRLAVLMVKSDLDPHMIIELEDDSKSIFLLIVVTNVYLIYLLWLNGINLYLVNAS